jgi:hypothetical protein
MVNRAKHALKAFLHSRGFRLERVQSLEESACPETAGKIVEFIGPSGVGKTATFQSLAPVLRERWHFQEHIAQHHYNAFKLDPGKEAFYERLVKGRCEEVLNQNATLPEKANRLAFSLKLVSEDMALVAQSYSRGFFIDDGLCHNFSSVLLDLLVRGDPKAKRVIRSRAFVVLLADDPDFVVENILFRRKHSHQFRGNNFPSLDHQQLRRFCAERNRECARLLGFFDRIGSLNLILRAEDGIEANSKKIRDFEEFCVRNA